MIPASTPVPTPRTDIRTRFFRFVVKGECCWEWIGSKTSSLYGHLKVNSRMITAHRVSWMLHNGPIPEGLYVLHKCDNPPCVNPDHLFLGTHQDNMDDKVAKGRQARGISLSMSKAKKEPMTHCGRGHEYTIENTRFYKGHRHCRACHRAYAIKYYYQKS